MSEKSGVSGETGGNWWKQEKVREKGFKRREGNCSKLREIEGNKGESREIFREIMRM